MCLSTLQVLVGNLGCTADKRKRLNMLDTQRGPILMVQVAPMAPIALRSIRGGMQVQQTVSCNAKVGSAFPKIPLLAHNAPLMQCCIQRQHDLMHCIFTSSAPTSISCRPNTCDSVKSTVPLHCLATSCVAHAGRACLCCE